jgi:hypothetical protein
LKGSAARREIAGLEMVGSHCIDVELRALDGGTGGSRLEHRLEPAGVATDVR